MRERINKPYCADAPTLPSSDTSACQSDFLLLFCLCNIAFRGPRNRANMRSCVIRMSVGSSTKTSICASGILRFISFMCLTDKPFARRALARRGDTHASANTDLLPIRSSRLVIPRCYLSITTHNENQVDDEGTTKVKRSRKNEIIPM
jgi:hypothetical protein